MALCLRGPCGWPDLSCASTRARLARAGRSLDQSYPALEMFSISYADWIRIPANLGTASPPRPATKPNCLVAEHRWDPVGLAIVDYAYRFERRKSALQGGR